MITKEDTVQERKIPMIGDIPIIGNAFRYDFKETKRTELIIFLTPRIIHNDEEAEMFKEIEIGRLNFIESDAERVYGPLHAVPAAEIGKPDPHYGFPAKPAVPSRKRGTEPPPPPEPSLPPGTADASPDAIPMPRFDEDAGASLMHGEDDDEDLDAAFIQTNYRAPARNADATGRARVGSASVKAPAKTKAGKRPAGGTARSRPKQEDDRPPARQSSSDPF
jgi:hypothetical protein